MAYSHLSAGSCCPIASHASAPRSFFVLCKMTARSSSLFRQQNVSIAKQLVCTVANESGDYRLRKAVTDARLLSLVDDTDVIDETGGKPPGIALIVGRSLYTVDLKLVLEIDNCGHYLIDAYGTRLYKLLDGRKEICTLASQPIANFASTPDDKLVLLTACLLGLVAEIPRPANFAVPGLNLNNVAGGFKEFSDEDSESPKRPRLIGSAKKQKPRKEVVDGSSSIESEESNDLTKICSPLSSRSFKRPLEFISLFGYCLCGWLWKLWTDASHSQDEF